MKKTAAKLRLYSLKSGYRMYAYLLFILPLMFKTNNAVNQSKQCIVAASANILTRVNFCSPLAHQNIAGQNELSVRPFHAQTLRLGITAVFRGADALFVSEKLNVYLQHKKLTPP